MESDLLIPIGQRMREVRRAHGITQEVLAEKLSVTPKHISHTECGTSSLSLSNLIDFCNIFNCSLDYIILGKKDSIISKLPNRIVDIIYSGDEKEFARLIKYLEFYVELTKK